MSSAPSTTNPVVVQIVNKLPTTTTTTTIGQESLIHRFIFGGISCMAAACVTTNSRGSLQIIRDEGIVGGLYRGLAPSLLREATYSTLRMGGYDLIKGYFVDSNGKTNLISKICAGAISGAVGASIANPSDLIKVRMQAYSTKGASKYTSISQAFREIIKNEGFLGLYKGVSPTTQRAALLTASQIPSYDHFKHVLIDKGLEEGINTHILSSIFAGFVAALVTSPVDLIKTRIMNQPIDENGKGRLYKSSLDCMIKTFKAEGILGLYKGFIPNWSRIGPHTIVTFIVYEYLRKLGGISPVMANKRDEGSNKFLKTILFGDNEVGKTSLALRFTTNKYDDKIGIRTGFMASIEVHSKKMSFVDVVEDYKLFIFDTSGMMSMRETFENLPYYIDIIKNSQCIDTPVILVGNKCDGNHEEKKVSTEEGLKFAKENGKICLWFKF
eukprot:gene4738-5914_t